MIDGKWKGVVPYHPAEGTLRSHELRRRLPDRTRHLVGTSTPQAA